MQLHAVEEYDLYGNDTVKVRVDADFVIKNVFLHGMDDIESLSESRNSGG